MDKHSAEQVVGVDSLDRVKQYLDKELDEKKLYKMISRWETLKDCRKSQAENVRNFVNKFDTAYEAVRTSRRRRG